jgi:hypothetical protein
MRSSNQYYNPWNTFLQPNRNYFILSMYLKYFFFRYTQYINTINFLQLNPYFSFTNTTLLVFNTVANSAAQRVEKNTKEQYVENPQKLLKFIQTWNIKNVCLSPMKKYLSTVYT